MKETTKLFIWWVYLIVYGGLLGASLLSLWLNPSWKLVLSTWFCIAGIIFFSYQAKNSLGEIVWREATEGLIKQIRKEREQQK